MRYRPLTVDLPNEPPDALYSHIVATQAEARMRWARTTESEREFVVGLIRLGLQLVRSQLVQAEKKERLVLLPNELERR